MAYRLAYEIILPYLLPLIHITLTGSVYTTIAVACERCITVLAPFTQIKVRVCDIYIVLNKNHFPFPLSLCRILVLNISENVNLIVCQASSNAMS